MTAYIQRYVSLSFAILLIVIRIFIGNQPTYAHAATPSPTPVPSKFNWARYKPNTLAAMIKRAEPDVKSDPGLWMSNGEIAASVVVTYTGKLRSLTKASSNLMYWVSHSLNVKPQFFTQFNQEMLVIENGVEYWLPVQKQLLPHFKKEAKPGTDILIFVTYFGANHSPEDHHIDWLFTINEFSTKRRA